MLALVSTAVLALGSSFSAAGLSCLMQLPTVSTTAQRLPPKGVCSRSCLSHAAAICSGTLAVGGIPFATCNARLLASLRTALQ